MNKNVVYGVLIGIVCGIFIEIIFPKILLFEFLSNVKYFEYLGKSDIKGSIYIVGGVFPMVTGFIGGLIVWVITKHKH